MGNRAVVSFDTSDDNAVGVYLHWNGGPESIEGFLQATRTLMGDRLGDDEYTRARFVQCVGVFLGGNLSFGLGQVGRMDADNGDNGHYIIDSATLTIKDHKHVPSHWTPTRDQAASDRIAKLIGKKLDAMEAIA